MKIILLLVASANAMTMRFEACDLNNMTFYPPTPLSVDVTTYLGAGVPTFSVTTRGCTLIAFSQCSSTALLASITPYTRSPGIFVAGAEDQTSCAAFGIPRAGWEWLGFSDQSVCDNFYNQLSASASVSTAWSVMNTMSQSVIATFSGEFDQDNSGNPCMSRDVTMLSTNPCFQYWPSNFRWVGVTADSPGGSCPPTPPPSLSYVLDVFADDPTCTGEPTATEVFENKRCNVLSSTMLNMFQLPTATDAVTFEWMPPAFGGTGFYSCYGPDLIQCYNAIRANGETIPGASTYRSGSGGYCMPKLHDECIPCPAGNNVMCKVSQVTPSSASPSGFPAGGVVAIVLGSIAFIAIVAYICVRFKVISNFNFNHTALMKEVQVQGGPPAAVEAGVRK